MFDDDEDNAMACAIAWISILLMIGLAVLHWLDNKYGEALIEFSDYMHENNILTDGYEAATVYVGEALASE